MKLKPFNIEDGPIDNEPKNEPMVNKVFEFILGLQQAALQLKMNHWQTTSYAEHKTTDAFVKILHKYSDEIAETAMGQFERPKINTTHINITDNTITSTRWTLDTVQQKTNEILADLRINDNEGLLALVGDFDAEFKKAIYLSTLE